MEFLVHFRTALPEAMTDDERQALRQAERRRGTELARSGVVQRIWRLPGRSAGVAVYDVADATELHDVLSSLPMFAWMDVTVEALAQHPIEQELRGG
jgi:muconolactone D-isomerase